MKKLLLFVFTIALLSIPYASNATHIMGGEITYECIGGNQYEISLSLYRDCYGVAAPTSATLAVSSSCFTGTINVTEDPGSGGQVPNGCSNPFSSCNGGTIPGVTKHTYTTLFTLPACDDYIISFNACCRNNAISNLINPGSQSFEIVTTLDNLNAPCNTAPTFSNLPVPFICVGESFTYDHGAIEPDGDSLVYYFTEGLTGPSTPVSYAVPFSATNPLPTDSGISLDPATGMLEFIPNQIGAYAITVKVDEYRNGALIGSIFRDMQFMITNLVCGIDTGNQPPSIDNSFLNVSGAVIADTANLITCAAQGIVNFDITVSDPDTGDIINYNWISIVGNVNLTITQTGSNPATFSVSAGYGFFGLPSTAAIFFTNDGCNGDVFEFTINHGNSIDYSLDIQQPGCGLSDGSLTVVPDSVPSSYTYLWSNGANSPGISGLSEGLYTVTISDVCSVVDSIYLFDSCGSISGFVFEDLNGNGIQDSGEVALAGVLVTVTGAGNTFSTVTDAGGNYNIAASDFTTYTVTINPPNYLVPCGSAMGGTWVPGSVSAPLGGSHSVVITSGSSVSTGNDFGVEPPPVQCGTIEGFVFDDTNGNGVQDTGELGYAGAIIIASTGQSTVSDQNGYYSMSVPLNIAVTVELMSGTSYYYCGTSAPSTVQTFPASMGTYTVTLSATNLTSTGNDFGVQQNSVNYDVGVAFIWTTQSLSAGDDFGLWMDYKSFGTTTSNCTLRLDFDPLLTFISSAIPPDNSGATWVEWVYLPGTTPSWYCMNVIFNLDSSAVAGDPLTFTGSWDCGGTDACPGNDSLSQTFTIQFGPLKTGAYESVAMFSTNRDGLMPYVLTEEDDVLSYVISFQNTSGNDVYCFLIENPISEHLDINTISFPFSSLPFSMTISDDNSVFFEFENIFLADSASDKLNSYGFIQYNIRVKEDLLDGTLIENKARFGWNTYNPEWTNTVVHEIEKASGIIPLESIGIGIYPNPSSGTEVNIVSDNASIEKISVYSTLGNLIDEISISGSSLHEKIEFPSNGIYLIEVVTDHGIISKKVISF